MKFVTRLAMASLMSVAAATAPAVATAASGAAPAIGEQAVMVSGDFSVQGRRLMNCGYDYNYCVQLRHAMVKDGYRVGSMWYNPPGCTAPGGCTGGYKFYYW